MQIPPTLRASTTNDGLVLLDVETGQIYTSNGVGGRIWHLLERGCSEAEIAEQLSAEYRRAPELIADDVREFIGGLAGLGVVA